MTDFLDLHHRDGPPLLLPNPWDVGSARLLESLGFEALATTSSGFAATLGRLDYGITREEALEHGAAIAAGVNIPVSADLENGFGDAPEEVAETIRRATQAGLAGGSIEDSTGRDDTPVYDVDAAAARIEAAANAAGGSFVLTARAENHLHGRDDLDDTIARLQAFEAAGADVLYAPGLAKLDDIEEVVRSVGKPVNVLAVPNAPTVAELSRVGVRRVSIGGAFAFAALGAAVDAADELRNQGTYGFTEQARRGAKAAQAAFGPRR
jgi:2-methylisocitrate lyase-like PEP mutase family enzyme